ncbi:SDR family oxidoreductase [soil metagenome]
METHATWAVITGASAGLGALFAEQLADQGHSLILTGRDRQRLEQVSHQVRERTPGIEVELVAGDLGTKDGVDALVAAIDGRPIEILVNNAGFGTYGAFAQSDAAKEHGMIGVNVDAIVGLTHAVLAGMVERGSGGILNVASTASFQPTPFQAGYGASKAFVLSFSQALWAETRGTGVTVTALCPGPTATGFFDGLGADVSHVGLYQNQAAPGPVVEAGLRGLQRGRAVVVPGWRNKASTVSGRMAPGWLSALLASRMLKPTELQVGRGVR